MAWSHHWRNVWRNIAGSRPNWAQDFTRTSQKNSRSSQKNYYQHSRNFGTSYFCLSYLLHKQAYVQLDEVTPVAGGLTLHQVEAQHQMWKVSQIWQTFQIWWYRMLTPAPEMTQFSIQSIEEIVQSRCCQMFSSTLKFWTLPWYW